LPELTSNTKEKDLVDHLLSRDTKRFGYIYDYFSASLFGIIRQIVQHDEQAEDILQETFFKIWSKADNYDEKKSRLFTWMLNIARNTSIDYLRSKQGKFDKVSQPIDSMIAADEPLVLTMQRHDHIGLRKIIGDLKNDQKEIIDLAFFEGYTQEEISKKLQIPLGTVKTRYRTAMLSLRKTLADK